MIRKQMSFWAAGFVSAALVAGSAQLTAAATKYWDINGTEPGSSIDGFVDEDWTADRLNWNTDPTGGAGGVITTFDPGDDAVFSAGTDAVDGIILSPGASGTNQQQPNSITIEEGQIEFQTAQMFNMQANTSVRVNEGATLQIPNLNVFSVNGPNVSVTLDGGTFRNTIVGVGSGIFANPAANPTKFLLTSKGGTIDTPNGNNDDVNGAYSIMLYGITAAPSIIGMADGTTSATLRKTGHGEFRAGKDWTFTNLIVEEGLYRINGDGGLDTGFGALDGTVTTMGGAEANTTNGSALGTSANIVSPETRSFVLGGTGDTMFVTNATFRINGPVSGPGGLMLNGWARNDTGAIIGSQGTSLILGGTNTYAGPTTINFGTLTTAGGAAIPDTSRVVISAQSEWGKAPATPATFNTAVLSIGASETVGSIAGGSATRGSINISGAAITLTTGADNTSSTYDGAITGAGSLKKIGTGMFTINGAKSYTGDTIVEGGTLSTNSASLADAADVYLSTGAALNLNFSETDTIDQLFFDGAAQSIGLWGAVGNALAQFTSPLITGTGLLQVTTGAALGLPGDFNNDLKVDAADYTVWRDHLGAADESSLNGNGDGLNGVDQGDYDLWKSNFGDASGSGAVAAAVPEPTSGLLMLIAAALAAACVRR